MRPEIWEGARERKKVKLTNHWPWLSFRDFVRLYEYQAFLRGLGRRDFRLGRGKGEEETLLVTVMIA